MKEDIKVAYSKDEKVIRSLRASYFDGLFASGMTGFTADYFTPFLLLIGGTDKHVGILNALQNLFSSLLQLKSADFTAWLKSRRKIFILFVFLQALMLLPMVACALAHFASPFVFMSCVALFVSFGALSMPAWSSLMSDLVNSERRGAYFGWRNKIFGFITVACGFLAGLILYFSGRFDRYYGFAIIFMGAFIFRMASGYFLTKMHEPPLNHSKENQFSLLMFISRFRESNFVHFVLFVALMNFSVNLAAPFFAVLMLKDLHFSYILYALITVTATLTICLVSSRWGRHADRIGNIKVLKFTAPMIAVVPCFWILNQNPLFLFLAQIFSGFAWAGFNLAASNFIYDAVTPEKRTRCIAYFNLFNGLALCLGSILGGMFIAHLPNIFGYKILALFFISSMLRIIVSVVFSRSLKEVRSIQRVSNKDLLLSLVGIRNLTTS